MTRAGEPGLHVAVDLGASSGRVVVGRLDDGVMRMTEVARFLNVPATGADGVLRWDIEALWGGVLGGLEAATRLGRVRSIGIDSWAVDYGLLDADGALLAAPANYRDARTDGMTDRFFERMTPAAHYAITGAQVQPFNTVFQLLAEAQGPHLAAASRLALIPDLLATRLGADPATELTNASTTGLLDARTRTWSPEVLATAESLTPHPLTRLLTAAPLIPPGTPQGETGGSARETGGSVPRTVAEGKPSAKSRQAAVVGRRPAGRAGASLVAGGSHDTASAVVAVPMADPTTAAYISSGTWSLVGLELDAPVLDEASRLANHTNELGVDGTVRYLKNVAGMWLLSESQRVWRARGMRADLAGLLAAAERAEPRRTVVDVDDPVFLPPGDMPARITDLARASGQPVPRDPGEFTRCILDSLAAAYRRAIHGLAAAAGRDVRVIHVVGGGARNALLCRLTAEATGLPVIAGPAEGAALGNLLVQARTLGAVHGELPTLRAVAAASSELTRYLPR